MRINKQRLCEVWREAINEFHSEDTRNTLFIEKTKFMGKEYNKTTGSCLDYAIRYEEGCGLCKKVEIYIEINKDIKEEKMRKTLLFELIKTGL